MDILELKKVIGPRIKFVSSTNEFKIKLDNSEQYESFNYSINYNRTMDDWFLWINKILNNTKYSFIDACTKFGYNKNSLDHFSKIQIQHKMIDRLKKVLSKEILESIANLKF